MKVIWKYEIQADEALNIQMPVGAEILAVQTQAGTPCIWVLVDPEEKETETRNFCTIGTGHHILEVEGKTRVYRGTFQLQGGALVFHLFEWVNN